MHITFKVCHSIICWTQFVWWQIVSIIIIRFFALRRHVIWESSEIMFAQIIASSTHMAETSFQYWFYLPGAFLIPFMIMLVLEGIPLFLIELGMGQRMRLGALGVWNTIHPWLGGIGISSCIVTLFVAIYYNVIITWCIFYFVNSFRVSFDFIFVA